MTKKFWRALVLSGVAIFLVAYTGLTSWPTGDQAITRGDLEALKGAGKVALTSSDPGWGTTNGQVATRSDFTTYFNNSGSCAGGSTQALTSSQLQACAVTVSLHSSSGSAGPITNGYYNPDYNSGTGLYGCLFISGGSGVLSEVTSSSALAPSSSHPQSLSLTSINQPTVASEYFAANLSVQLKNPAGSVVFSDTISSTATTYSSGNITSGSGSTGTWTWVISATSSPSCNSSTGVTSYGQEFSFNYTVDWYQ